jgi:hypothetical protein
MYCPKCGQNASDGQNFCKFCGTNLSIVLQALMRGTTPVKSLSETTAKILEDWFGGPPEPPLEVKRMKEIRGGVVTSLVGVGISIFLYFLMGAVSSLPDIQPEEALVIRSVWLGGLIPLCVGLGLLISGIFLHRAPKRSPSQGQPQSVRVVPTETQRTLPEPGVVIPPSVTEQTTYRLESPEPVPGERQREAERQ